MLKEELIAKMVGEGYELSPNTDYYYSRCWGKSGGDMEYVNLRQMIYSKEHSADNEDNFAVDCADIQELADWVLY